MKQYLKVNEWSIIEDSFDPNNQELSESIFSIGNGHIGQRANFEEAFSGQTLPGSYMAGVYYPDKTRVGWWKNGYPEYFAKVLNMANWIGIDIKIDGETLDLARCKVDQFYRELNMKEGYLLRRFTATLDSGKQIQVEAQRFTSLARPEVAAIMYAVTPVNFAGVITFTPFLNGDVMNRDSNHGEQFWDEVEKYHDGHGHLAGLVMKTKKLDFYVCSTMTFEVFQGDLNKGALTATANQVTHDKFVGQSVDVKANKDERVTLYKYITNVTSRDHAVADLIQVGRRRADEARSAKFETLLSEQKQAWAKKWEESDIIIQGDPAAQQGIRFNIFQLNQTYTGADERLNIGPKGFTGEKYGGSTYWDTEAYCLPFYLSTADPKIARNLLIYRYRHLEKAKENARKLGFKEGALYPMVTMNGEECHNEWEITFEEIHRNGAIAHAIYDYVNYTGDVDYLGEYGFEVLAEISRFWSERTNLSTLKNKYVILGVTGPNEYENNVNNNWYTNRIASWTMEYTLQVLTDLRQRDPKRLQELLDRLQLTDEETNNWQHIIQNMYYPTDKSRGVFLQQDGYLDKEIIPVKDLPAQELPLNQHWSWDRILRSCYIKQADVLQGLFFLGNQYDLETKKRNFDFYEPLTVHESSLSPCVHSILACELSYQDKAYDMYLRTSRLDLDNYNNDTEDGCHITSMAGTWMSVVYGFGGLRVKEGRLHLQPLLPKEWQSLSFKVVYRGALIHVHVSKDGVTVHNETETPVSISVSGENFDLGAHEKRTARTV